jgi:hypothetical protein
MHYALQAARAKDKTSVMRVLGLLANASKGHAYEDIFLHTLVTYLIQVGQFHVNLLEDRNI